jgi:hypothetical protein
LVYNHNYSEGSLIILEILNPEGLLIFAFHPLSGKQKKIRPLRPQRLCGENEIQNAP